jgi:hypothetical protein
VNRRLLAAAGLLLALAGCGSASPSPAAVDQHRPRPTHSPRPTAQPSVTPTVVPTIGPTMIPTAGPTGVPISYPAHCTARDGNELPDPACTPGALNPAVTRANIHQTVCVPGWTSTVRPPVSYTGKVKVLAIAAYGDYAGSSPAAYELDHFVPLSLGGAPWDVANLFPEGHPSPNPKDNVEYSANRAVCSGKISLGDAQIRMATNWIKLGHDLDVPGIPAS